MKPYPEEWAELLDKVNATVNAMPYTSDSKRFGVPDGTGPWTDMKDGTGDCKAFAIEKLNELFVIGYPIEALRLATCELPYDMNINSPRGGHLVLVCATPEGMDCVLSQGISYPMRLTQFLARGFRPLSIQPRGGVPEMVEWSV